MALRPRPNPSALYAPIETRRVVEIERIGPLDREIRIVLATQLYGYLTHYIQHTFPHSEPRDKCPGCLKNNRRRPYFWLHCMHQQTKRQTFVEFTNDGAKDFIEVMAGRGFRGKRVMFSRIGGMKRRSILTTVLGDVEDRDCLPEARDPGATLTLLWNQMITFETNIATPSGSE